MHGPVIDEKSTNQLGEPQTTGASVIIVAYNNESCIAECLQSVLAHSTNNDEIIVVDNASQDRTLPQMEPFLIRDPRLQVICETTNLGYSAGCNRGLKASKGTHLVLLNPDTVVFPRFIEKMRRGFSPDAGAVGPLSDNVGGDQFLGTYVEPGFRLTDLQDIVTERFANQIIDTKLLIGLCVMLRRDILNEIGLLDEDLFLGNDDLELSWRIRTHGLKLLVAKDVYVHHKHHVSFNTLKKSVVHDYIKQSDEALRRKLAQYYGDIPSNQELWGVTFHD